MVSALTPAQGGLCGLFWGASKQGLLRRLSSYQFHWDLKSLVWFLKPTSSQAAFPNINIVHNRHGTQQRKEQVRQQGGFQRQRLCLVCETTDAAQQPRQQPLVFLQNPRKEATWLYDWRRERKVEFTRDHLLRKEPDFENHSCVLIYLPSFQGSFVRFHSFPIFKF